MRRSTAGTGVEVTYTRSGTSATLTVTPFTESPDVNAQPAPSGTSAVRERFYFIVFDDMVTAGFDLPADGDRITETVNGVDQVFEVGRSRTVPAWRWADDSRTRLRVRTIPRAG